MMRMDIPAIVVIGGLDPSGGAGVLVDFAAARSMGVHAAAVVTLDTLQDGRRFFGGRVKDPSWVETAFRAMKERFRGKVVKLGALGNVAVARKVMNLVREFGDVTLVVDPVLASTTGGPLMDGEGEQEIRESILKEAALITPNTVEAAALVGGEIRNLHDMREAASRLVEMGAGGALVKGGHLEGETVADVLCLKSGEGTEHFVYRRPRLEVGEVRGTGCALASLVASGLARGMCMEEACRTGIEKLASALERSAVSGAGPGFLVF